MPQTFEDWAGTRHPKVTGEARIVSLVPSLTETLFYLGLGEALVGRTQFCVHPEGDVAAIPSVGGTKKIRMDRLQDLRPTHVLVNVDENPKEMADEIAALGVSVVVTHPNQPSDNSDLYRLLGGIFNREAEAEQMANRFMQEMVDLEMRGHPPRKVLYLIWQDPFMTIAPDTYIAKTLKLIGWDTGDWGEGRYPEVEITPEVAAAVDMILMSSEPFRFDQSHHDALVAKVPEAAGKVFWINGEMTSWYGTRAILGMQYLEQISPEPPAGFPCPS